MDETKDAKEDRDEENQENGKESLEENKGSEESKKRAIIEAALFMSPGPIKSDKLSRIVGLGVPQTIKLIQDLMEDFNSRSAGLEIVRIADSGYRMQVRDEFLPYVKDLAVELDMSKALLRTLAVVAFKQPIKQSDVVKVRGNKAYEHIKELIDRGFIRSRKFRNTILLETTRKFEEYFGSIEGSRASKLKAQKRLEEYVNTGPAEQDKMG